MQVCRNTGAIRLGSRAFYGKVFNHKILGLAGKLETVPDMQSVVKECC